MVAMGVEKYNPRLVGCPWGRFINVISLQLPGVSPPLAGFYAKTQVDRAGRGTAAPPVDSATARRCQFP